MRGVALPRVFALAPLFWLMVLLGMGSLDHAARGLASTTC